MINTINIFDRYVLLMIIIGLHLNSAICMNYRTYGDWGRIVVPLSAAVVSITKADYSGVGWLILDELVVTGVVEITKRTFKRTRPDGGELSFPSGHAAYAFTGASYLHMRYGLDYISISAYIAASLVAHSRVTSKRHHVTDVIGAAAISLLFSYLIVRPYENIRPIVGINSDSDICLGIRYTI